MMWLLLLTLASSIFASTHQEELKCGYKSCHPTKDGFINAHIVPHTHDDVGWMETVDEYFKDAGFHNTGGVREILTSSFNSLLKNDTRRFMYVESAFLFKWWKEQSPETQALFKYLINSGRLELVSGGWSMNDEATTHYHSIIDQFTLGLSKLNETFGPCGRPKAGWQIDPFGHSSEMASIFANLGFDGIFLGRIDYRDKAKRFKEQTAEMLWQGSNSLGKESEIFTSVLYNTYYPPKGLCFDQTCHEAEFLRESHYKWTLFHKYLDEVTGPYRTNNILLTMGGDFHYTQAETWFRNLDQLIQYGNAQQAQGSKYNLMYSTPSCYLKAVQEEARKNKITWPTKTDDFFPYASTEHALWTGYFTSRPALKRFERIGNNFLQVCKQLQVLGSLQNAYSEKVDSLKEAMGVLQHHDAVSGTEKQYVANDYARSLHAGLENCGSVSSEALNNLMHNQEPGQKLSFSSCLLTNITQCTLTEASNRFVVTIYNPLSRPVDQYVRIPVTEGRFSVIGPNEERPILQMIPIPEPVLHIPGRASRATMELVFRAAQVPALGFKSFFIEKDTEDENKNPPGLFNNDRVSVTVSEEKGFLTNITMNGKSIPISQQFMRYNTGSYPSPSGAYLFHPRENEAFPVSESASYVIHEGKIMTEIHQTFNEWVSQIVRTYHDENFVEFQWLVGPLPDDPKHNAPPEVISRFTTNLVTNATFFTDSNGRGMMERIKDFRPTWDFKSTQPVTENYYPVTSKIMIRDAAQDVEVAVLTDRSQGGSSLRDGEIELMVHRKSYRDDGLGVQERLNEQAFGKPLVVRGSHYLVVGPYINQEKANAAALAKDVAQRKLLEAWTFLSAPKEMSYQDYSKLYKMEYSGLNQALPKNIQLLTLEPHGDNRLLIRLEHVFEKDEDLELSKSVTVDIEKLFSAFKIVDMRETTLGGNQWLDENDPLEFDPKARSSKKYFKVDFEVENEFLDNIDVVDGNLQRVFSIPQSSQKFKVTLGPMQIRTFVLTIGATNI